jgi:hypothetical protein
MLRLRLCRSRHRRWEGLNGSVWEARRSSRKMVRWLCCNFTDGILWQLASSSSEVDYCESPKYFEIRKPDEKLKKGSNYYAVFNNPES